jgi:hypothetical protein
MKDRALPQTGRDVVKFGGMDGLLTSSCGGHPRSLNAKQGKADERHT